jgi:branched-subunit amino acid transport protein
VTAWIAIALVGSGSYAFRLLPLLLADRWTPGPRVARTLRHSGIAALAAIAASSLHAPSLSGSPRATLAALAALAVGAERAHRGASMAVVVGAGAATHAAVWLLAGTLTG